METESRFLIKNGVLMQYLGHEEEATIPDTCTSIGVRAFKDQAQLRWVVVPKSVKDIGESAFEGCPRLTGITLPASLTEIGEKAFEGHGGNRHPCPGGQLCGAVRQGEQHQISAAVKVPASSRQGVCGWSGQRRFLRFAAALPEAAGDAVFAFYERQVLILFHK